MSDFTAALLIGLTGGLLWAAIITFGVALFFDKPYLLAVSAGSVVLAIVCFLTALHSDPKT